MNEWSLFARAICGNDVTAAIAVATPEFVRDNEDCLEEFCHYRCDFDGDSALISHLLALGANFGCANASTAIYADRPKLLREIQVCAT
jgi:hypothetical protein